MYKALRRTLPILLVTAIGARAQFYKLHEASIAVGATGQFTTPLTSSPSAGQYNVPFGTGISTYSTTISNQQQYTTNSAGLITSFQFHPAAWAGVELNYGYTHYSERYSFNYSNTTALQKISIPTSAHEATAAYSFHPKHIPLQPFLNVGGGAIDFVPRIGANQWRGAGLAEVGFDVPMSKHMKHIGMRVEGRSLFYRAPNFYQSAISTRGWRVTAEPSISTYYQF